MMTRARISTAKGTLWLDERGASVMEFALIAPVAMFMMMGAMDIGQTYYVRAVLDGAVQNAARSSSLQAATSEEGLQLIDARLRAAVTPIAPGVAIRATRRYYENYSKASQRAAELINENAATANGVCDNGETFQDANRNGLWDADGGSDGQGGAKDVVLIKYTVSFPRLFPMARLAGWPNTVEIESNSILANQPYGEQAASQLADIVACQ